MSTAAMLAVVTSSAYGTWLLWTAMALRWQGLGPGPRDVAPRRRPPLSRRLAEALARAGAPGVRPAEVAATTAIVVVVTAGGAYALFGGLLPPLASALFVAGSPLALYRSRHERLRERSHDAWPRLIEEIRLLTGSVGLSIPQALLEVGRRGPEPLRPAFAAAEREWRITTDFARTTAVLAEQLADPTADVVCETLLVAHEVGGADLEARLTALAEDRADDLRHRKDARAAQAGVRFARRFVLAVPVGMALCGLSIGTGRRAYGTAVGQLLVVVGIASVAACWAWAGRLLRLPTEDRVFRRPHDGAELLAEHR
ncbi:MAG: type II secretion system F family protein [Acidimicrobiales bacterium]